MQNQLYQLGLRLAKLSFCFDYCFWAERSSCSYMLLLLSVHLSAWFAKVYCSHNLCRTCSSHKGCGNAGCLSEQPNTRIEWVQNPFCCLTNYVPENIGSTVPIEQRTWAASISKTLWLNGLNHPSVRGIEKEHSLVCLQNSKPVVPSLMLNFVVGSSRVNT